LENQAKKYAWPALVSIAVLFLSTEIAILIPDTVIRVESFKAALSSIVIGFIASGIAFVIVSRFFNQQKEKTAQWIDEKQHAQNRLEAAAELEGTNHIFKKAQLEESVKYFSKTRTSSWPLWRTGFVTFALMLFLGQGTFLYLYHQISQNAQLDAAA